MTLEVTVEMTAARGGHVTLEVTVTRTAARGDHVTLEVTVTRTAKLDQTRHQRQQRENTMLLEWRGRGGLWYDSHSLTSLQR